MYKSVEVGQHMVLEVVRFGKLHSLNHSPNLGTAERVARIWVT